MTTTTLQNIVTVAEAAEALGISTRTVSRICANNNIGRVIGTVRVMLRSDLKRIERLRRPPGRPTS